MRKNTIKTLALATVILLGLTQVNANIDADPADKLTMNIWSNEQTVELSKQDTITNLAWSKEDNTLVAQAEYKINAFAADIEEESVKSTDKADTVTKNIWANGQTAELSKQDAITNLAWSKEDNTLVAQGEYKINAYAADIEEKSVESTDKADTVTKNIWANGQTAELSKQDAITNLAWSKEDNTLVAQGEYKINAFAADIEEESVKSTDKADLVTKNVWCYVANKNS